MKCKSINVTTLVAIAGLIVGTSSLRAQNEDTGQQNQNQSASTTPENVQNGVQNTMEQARNERIAQSPSLFIQTANQNNLTEIQLGKIAEQKGQSQKVKDFGKDLVKGHQALNDKLEQLAKQKGIACSTTLDARHQMEVDRVSAYPSDEFDKRFLENQTKAHKQDVALFEQVASKSPDNDIKDYAQNSLPGLRQHLQMAEGAMIQEPAGAQMEQPKQPQQNQNQQQQEQQSPK